MDSIMLEMEEDMSQGYPVWGDMLTVDEGPLFYRDNVTSVQTRQMLALRSFYEEIADLVVWDSLDMTEQCETRITVTDQNYADLVRWLKDSKTFIAFHPRVVVVDNVLQVVF